MSPYTFRQLRRIAKAAGPCLPERGARGRRGLLEHIWRAAQDFRTDPSALPGEQRDQLLELADAADKTKQLMRALAIGSSLRLGMAAQARGFRRQPDSEYLTELATAARTAAGDVPVQRGPQDQRVNTLIRAVAIAVEFFCGWRGIYTYNELEDRYEGRFFELVRACFEPFSVEMSDRALAKAIRHAVAAKAPIKC